MKKLTLIIFLSTIVLSSLFANGLSLNSVGPKALSMGGAYVGLADNASALYWNPAALANQENSFTGVLTDVIPLSSYKADGTDYGYPAAAMDIDAEGETNHYFNPNLFANYRMNKFAFGFGVYVPAGLGAEYKGSELSALSAGIEDVEWLSKIGVINSSPAVAYQINEKISVGAAINIYYGMFEMKRLAATVDTDADGIDDTAYQYAEDSDGFGFSATFSTMYRPIEKLSLGLTFRLPTKVTLEGEAENVAMPLMGMMSGMTVPEKSDFEREVTWPMWIGGGLAYRLNERNTFTFDAQYSQWSVVDEFSTDFDDEGWAALTAHHDENLFVLNWEDKVQLRAGYEFKATDALDLRFGYYYDPAPSPDESINILFPSSTNHVATGGFGYTYDNISIDFGLEYLFGADRDIEIATKWYDDNNNSAVDPGEIKVMNNPGTHHLDVFAYSIGINYKF